MIFNAISIAAPRSAPRYLYKYILVMKLTTLLLIIALVQASAATSYSQVKLSAKNESLESVFVTLKAQTGYTFFYDLKDVKDAKVTVELNDVSLKDALDKCFDGLGLTYKIKSKTVFVLKSEVQTQPKSEQQQNPPPAPPVTITGKVTDSVGTPLIGATISIKGTKTAVITDDKGEFQIKANQGDVLLISFIGYKPREITLTSSTNNIVIPLMPAISGLKEVVISNGYQKISAERATGSYDYIDNQLINRSVGANILDRLTGVASGLQVRPGIDPTLNGPSNIINSSPVPATKSVIIRGIATISSNVNATPLVVVDDFPYIGNINNINPNDIESISILKDAAAASIWGSQAGNGVIVITTKHGKLRQKMQVDFYANATILSKPNLFDNPNYIGTNAYINTETYLFNKGYYNNTLTNTSTYPAYSPIVSILAQQRAGTISATDAANQINAYRNFDVRSDENKYFYQTGLNQQYSLGLSGGSNDLSYRIGTGWDNNKATSVGNTFNRKTLSAVTTYLPLKGLEINTDISYAQYQNNELDQPSVGPTYERLADANGSALPITYSYTSAYINSLVQQGYLDWNYYPLNELHNTSNQYLNRDLKLNVGVTYKITNFLNVQAQYQNETQNSERDYLQNQQSYFVTNLINTYSQYDPSSNTLTQVYPLGALYTKYLDNYDNNNYRLQANFNKNIGEHQVTGLLGAEVGETSTKLSTVQYDGYDPQFGTFNDNLDFFTSFSKTPTGSSTLPSLSIGNGVTELRKVSYFANLGDSYKDRYTLSLTARKDGSNIFGVNTNDRFNLLWSVGGAWNINKEEFYHLDWLPNLTTRLSYGFSGNVYNGSGYTVGSYGQSTYTSLPDIIGLTAPNPNLTWETVRQLNLGLGFALINNILYGSIDAYRKDGLNLIESIPIARVTGFTSYTGNAANTKGKGLELNLNSDIIRGKFKWTANLLANFNADIITKYNTTLNSSYFYQNSPDVVGKPVSAIYSYKWAGLDPANGNPRGYLNGQVSENYSKIISNYKPDSLVYNGSAIPTAYGTLRNNFTYHKLTLSVMVGYEAGFYFRKPSTTGNYTSLLSGIMPEYAKAWQQPGDELTTNVPSFIYPANTQRATFYQYSQVLVKNGANIRLNDIHLEYDLSDMAKHIGFSRLSVFSYARINKLLWTANKDHLDPDGQYNYSAGDWIANPFTLSFGLTATLK